MMKRITEALQEAIQGRILHRLSYEIVILNGDGPVQGYVEVTKADHIPRKGEVIGVPIHCNRDSKGTSFLTVKDVYYSATYHPRVTVDRRELRHLNRTPPNPLERRAG